MKRRDFLKLSAIALSGACAGRHHKPASNAATKGATGGAMGPAAEPNPFDHYFLQIFDGFQKNALATAADYAVCDFPDGTKLKSCCTPSGRTYVSVARMLPPMVDWHMTGRDRDVGPILLSIYKNAFDPSNPNFWGYAPADKATQLSVEAALVASSLARLGEPFVAQLSEAERVNIQKWLASCTQVPERKTNHAWFSAVNQAARLQLSRKFPEFQGDEAWMIEDLKALDALGENSSEGWYSDSAEQPIYDVYNFYVFPNFPLMWSQIIGAQYPEWNSKFRARVRTFLQTTPYFFAENGAHPLMGRSLIYRWAVLSPLVLGYQQGLWPHSPGLLRRIVRKQLEYHWSLGCYDEEKGKLRETFSDEGTPVTREPYVDNGHPYWTMLGFAFLSIPKRDPFWTAKEEPLPVERGNYLVPFAGPKFLLSGKKKTGEVRWIQAQNSAKRDVYRDKYNKFTWSSHFGFCAAGEKEPIPPDQALVFRDIKTGAMATRSPNGVTDAQLLDDGVETTWWAKLNDWNFKVVTRVRLIGDIEQRTHHVIAPAGAVNKVELLEGSFASPEIDAIKLKTISGYDRAEVRTLENVNLIHKTVKVRVAIGKLIAHDMVFAVQQTALPTVNNA